MSITDGRVDRIIGDFRRLSDMVCLNFSSNNITKFEDNRSLGSLHKLTTLDLSHNNLSDVPRFRKNGAISLDISGNFLTNRAFYVKNKTLSSK